MLEAVNSVLQNAPFVKGNVEQASPVDAFGGNPDRVQKSAKLPQAPYISPYISMDLEFDQAVLQIRDSETGDVLRQYPSEPTLQARQVRQQAKDVAAPQQSEQENRSQAANVRDGADVVTASDSPGTQKAPQATAQQIAAFDAASRAGTSQSTTTVLA